MTKDGKLSEYDRSMGEYDPLTEKPHRTPSVIQFMRRTFPDWNEDE